MTPSGQAAQHERHVTTLQRQTEQRSTARDAAREEHETSREVYETVQQRLQQVCVCIHVCACVFVCDGTLWLTRFGEKLRFRLAAITASLCVYV